MVAALAVFAVSAIASASASAFTSPVFVRCAEVVEPLTGNFTDNKCTTVGAGAFVKTVVGGTSLSATEECAEVAELNKGNYTTNACTTKASGSQFIKVKKGKLKFTDKEGVSHLISSVAVITCQKDTSKGELTGSKTVGNVEDTFEECTTENKKTKEVCKVNGGTITTETLSGELGAVAVGEAASKVGEALKPTTGATFVELKTPCLEVTTTKVTGSVIGEVKPVGPPLVAKGELNFECEPAGSTKQKIQKLEGGVKDTLTTFGVAACFESFPDVITFEEPIEVT